MVLVSSDWGRTVIGYGPSNLRIYLNTDQSRAQVHKEDRLFLKAERRLYLAYFDNVSGIQLTLADNVFSIDLELAFAFRRRDEIFVIALADQRGAGGREIGR